MKNKFSKTIFLAFLTLSIHTISSAQKAINAAGKTDYGNNIIVQYAIGEVVVEEIFSKANIVTQGVLQPNYVISSVKSVFDDQYSLRCYPNPVVDALNIETDFKGFTAVKIFNEQGQLMGIKTFNYAPINLSELTTGAYLLTLYSADTHVSKTIKIIKQ
jgi:hypothetical protein